VPRRPVGRGTASQLIASVRPTLGEREGTHAHDSVADGAADRLRASDCVFASRGDMEPTIAIGQTIELDRVPIGAQPMSAR